MAIKLKTKTSKAKKQEGYDLYTHGLTQSMLTSYRQCPTMSALKQMGYRRDGEQSGAIAFGNIYHQAQDIVLSSIRDGLTKDDMDREFYMELYDQIEKDLVEGKNLTSVELENFEMAMLLAEQVLPRYFSQWSEIYFGKDRFELISLEEEFHVPNAFGKIPFRGKIDGKLRDSSGNLWLLEHKTKSSWDESELLSIIPRELQVGMYSWANEQIFGERPVGVIYNLTRRPQLRYAKTKETLSQFGDRVGKDIDERSDFYFQKLVISLSESDILRTYEMAAKTAKRIESDILSGKKQTLISDGPEKLFQKGIEQFTHSCSTVYGACQFVNVCGSKGKDLHGLTKRERLFSELDFEKKL